MGGTASPRAHLLGSPLFLVGEGSVEPARSKRWLVPVYLAAHDGWVSRDELGVLLWGEGTDARARHNLRQVLHALKQTPIGPALDIEDERLRFPGRTDLEAFTREIDRCSWQQAVEHYRGPFLTGWSFPTEPNADAWIVRRREEIEMSYRRALRASADELAHTAPVAAAGLYERLWRYDVLDDQALRSQLSCLQRAGMNADAAAVAESYRETFTCELDAHPEGELAELLQTAESRTARAHGQSPSPPRRARLPTYPTPFVGRGRELARLGALLEGGGPRLVSIVGLGGSGKTRLALELAGRAARDDRVVVWTSLVDVASSAELIAAMASSMGIDSTGEWNRESLAAHIGEREMLVVIDNAEHLRDDLVEVADHVLSLCPHAAFLVTTRIVLGARFEHVEQIEGLSMRAGDFTDAARTSPNTVPDESSDVGGQSSDAATLFRLSSARRSRSGEVALDHRAVEQICREVEGIPLAIELIASWSDVVSAEDLLSEVRGDLASISHGAELHDLPERQRSLKSVFDGTWHRLSDQGKHALLALAPCVASVALSDARALGAELSGLRSLADAAIVRRDGHRLSIHPLIAEFARTLARRDPELWQSVEARHSAHYLGKLTAAPKAPNTYEVERFHDLGNLRASLVWAAEHVDAHTFGDALMGLHLIEMGRGLSGDPAFTQAIKHRARGPNRIHALVREVWQLLHGAVGDYGVRWSTPREDAEAAKALALEALAEARKFDDPLLLRVALHYLAAVYNMSGEQRAAIEVAREALRVDTDWGWPYVLDKLAYAHSCLGEYASARRSFLRALAWICRNNESIAVGWIPHSIAYLDLLTGQYDAAERVIRAVRDAEGSETPLRWRIERFFAQGQVAESLGDLKSATHAFEAAIELCQGMDPMFRNTRGGLIHGDRALVAILEGDFETARVHLDSCRSPGYGPLWRGRLALALGDHRSAIAELATAAEQLPEESFSVGFVSAHLRARAWLAVALAGAGDLRGAKTEVEAALEHALRRKLPVEILACSASGAVLFEAGGELARAQELRAWVRDHAATDADTRLAVGGPALRNAGDADTNDVLERGHHLLAALRQHHDPLPRSPSGEPTAD